MKIYMSSNIKNKKLSRLVLKKITYCILFPKYIDLWKFTSIKYL